jgi:hypothetical protein
VRVGGAVGKRAARARTEGRAMISVIAVLVMATLGAAMWTVVRIDS